MAKPFVSYDGADEHSVRAEVWVQTGTGTVTTVEHQDDETKLNAMVVLASVNPLVKRPVKGWVSKQDPLYRAVLAASASGVEVEYRVESQRRRGVDRGTPITDLRASTETAGATTISILAALDGAPSREAVTDPDEDPSAGGRIPAARDGAATAERSGAEVVALSPEQALTALATARRTGLPEGVVDAAAALALASGATARQVHDAGFTEQGGAARLEPRRAHAQEAAPHVPYNSDHRVNLGSYAVQAAFSAEKVAHDILAAKEQATFEAHNAAVGSGSAQGTPMLAPVPVDLTHAAALGEIFLALADRVQVGAYGGGRPDRMANSHTRARYLVFDSVRSRNPVPFGADPDVRRSWTEAVVAEGVERFRTLALVSQKVVELPARQPEEPQDAGAEGEAQHEVEAQDQPQAEVQAEARAEVEPRGRAGRPAGAARRTRASHPPVDGQDGFLAPSPEVVARFGALAQRAGFTPQLHGPVAVYLHEKFGVERARAVHGPALDALVRWYEQREDGVATFRRHAAVLSTDGEQRASA